MSLGKSQLEGERQSVRVHCLLSFPSRKKTFGEKCYLLRAVNSYSHFQQIKVQVFLGGEGESKGVLIIWGK